MSVLLYPLSYSLERHPNLLTACLSFKNVFAFPALTHIVGEPKEVKRRRLLARLCRVGFFSLSLLGWYYLQLPFERFRIFGIVPLSRALLGATTLAFLYNDSSLF